MWRWDRSLTGTASLGWGLKSGEMCCAARYGLDMDMTCPCNKATRLSCKLPTGWAASLLNGSRVRACIWTVTKQLKDKSWHVALLQPLYVAEPIVPASVCKTVFKILLIKRVMALHSCECLWNVTPFQMAQVINKYLSSPPFGHGIVWPEKPNI